MFLYCGIIKDKPLYRWMKFFVVNRTSSVSKQRSMNALKHVSQKAILPQARTDIIYMYIYIIYIYIFRKSLLHQIFKYFLWSVTQKCSQV